MLQFFANLWANVPLKCAAVSWCVAQGIKVLISLWLDKKLDWRRCFGMGGMPSSHSAFVFSLMLSIAVKETVASTQFALAFALAAVVIYDAMGVRWQAGQHARTINELLLKLNGAPPEKMLEELLGHTPLQVAVGALLGALVAILYSLR